MDYRRLVSALIIALLAGCAGHQQMWYRPGGNQMQFDTDARECELVARGQALEESATGDRVDPVTYAKYFDRCIRAKGWSDTPPGTAPQPAPPPPPLARRDGNRLQAFGHQVALPATARLLDNSRQAIGPTTMESFLFQDGDTFYNVIFQQSETSFEKVPYPVEEPARLYDRDTIAGRAPYAAFWIPGATADSWVMGMGAYLRLDRKHRCILVVTSPMAPPAAPPPPGLSLAANQRQAMEDFLARHRPWLEAQVPPPSLWQRALHFLGGAM